MAYNIREMTIGYYEEAYHLLFSIYDSLLIKDCRVGP